jgi:hypothetical protein
MEYWWNDADWLKQKYSQKNLSLYHFEEVRKRERGREKGGERGGAGGGEEGGGEEREGEEEEEEQGKSDTFILG